jgi:tetratricopeptide (TPR) repeat protein
VLHALPGILALVLALTTWSSGRPPECADEGGRGGNVWERAKSPELRRYCDLVASASSKLAGSVVRWGAGPAAGAPMAQSALEAAREAERVLPGHAAARILEGRALAALGKLPEALAALRDGKARDPRALDDPPSLLAWARVLARTGHAEEAAEAYRALLPRGSALASADRAAAGVEAGLVAMTRGAGGLDDAAGALREAVREAQDEAAAVAVLALALALDRRGDGDEAHALLSERAHGDPRATLASPRAMELLAVAPAESEALAAIGLEPTDAGGARDAWQKYLAAAPGGPWAAHARTHLARPPASPPRKR